MGDSADVTSTEGVWPNLFIVGVPRGGTTSLWHYLRQHPDVFMSEVKEPYYFSDHFKLHGQFPKDQQAYLRLFAGARDALWRGEASTAYFWDPPSAGRIKESIPDARIIISLRDPADRAYSEYLQNLLAGSERRTFDSVVQEEIRAPRSSSRSNYLFSSFYLDDLRRYTSLFGSNVHVLLFEDLVSDPQAVLARIFAFLGLDEDVSARVDVAPLNSSGAPRQGMEALLRSRLLHVMPSPISRSVRGMLVRPGRAVIPRQARAALDELYATERSGLEALLGRQLPWGAEPASAGPPTLTASPG